MLLCVYWSEVLYDKTLSFAMGYPVALGHKSKAGENPSLVSCEAYAREVEAVFLLKYCSRAIAPTIATPAVSVTRPG